MQQEKLYEAFLQFDSNGDGKIGADDLIQILGENG